MIKCIQASIFALLLSSCTGYFIVARTEGQVLDNKTTHHRITTSLQRMGYRLVENTEQFIETDWRAITLYTRNKPSMPLVPVMQAERREQALLSSVNLPEPVSQTKSYFLWRYKIRLNKQKVRVHAECIQQHVANLAVEWRWIPCYDTDTLQVVIDTANYLVSSQW